MSRARKTICIDIDGVLAKYDGWKGEDTIGEPLEGAKSFIERLREDDWYIILHTTRDNMLIYEWAKEHGIYFDAINHNPCLPDVGNPGKPVATVYLDDRAVRFEGNFAGTLDLLLNKDSIKVWYEK